MNLRPGAGLPLNAALDALRLRRASGRPTQIHLSVTDRCFLPCLHCDIWKNKTPDLPFELWRDTLDRLHDWLGPVSVNFVGGEPLLRKDLEALFSYATALGNTVSFNTNAWLLNKTRAQKIADAGVSIVYISMDGAREATIDHSRGRAGSFRKCQEAFELFDKLPNPRVVVSCILHGKNAEEIPELLEFVRHRGYQLVLQPLYQTFGDVAYDPDWYKTSPLWPTADELPRVHAALDLLAAERRRGGPVCNAAGQLIGMKGYFSAPSVFNGLTCKAGHSDLAFDPKGNVRLCYFLEPVATVFDLSPLIAIWDAPKTLRRRWEVSRCERSCNLLNCNFDRADQ
ncbi:MAG: radical SAM protein [Deltaproteobacteria bacterium]|nr:radical SAM protein [Deltaproteobacteria bacterium]